MINYDTYEIDEIYNIYKINSSDDELLDIDELSDDDVYDISDNDNENEKDNELYYKQNIYKYNIVMTDYETSLIQLSSIVYDYYNFFDKNYVNDLFGDIYYPLYLYFHKELQYLLLGNILSNTFINNIGKKIKRLYYIHNYIIKIIYNILHNETTYKLVKKKFYNEIYNYILILSHNFTSFDKDNLRVHIDHFIDNY